MSELRFADRLATKPEVIARRVQLLSLAERHGFMVIALTEQGYLIVHEERPSYHRISKLAGEASRLVGAYVQIITDDVPAAGVPARLL